MGYSSTPASAPTAAPADRASAYKNRGAFKQDDLRRRRGEQQVELRRQKRDEHLAKRRNIGVARRGTGAGVDGSDADSDLSDIDDLVAEEDEHKDMPLPMRLQTYTALVYSSNESEQKEGVIRFRRLLSKEHNPPITQVIQCNVVHVLVQFLASPDPDLVFESAWALTNIASGDTEHTQAVLDAGALPHFIHLLQHPVPKVVDQAIWALGNISGESATLRDLVLNSGITPHLVRLMADGSQAWENESLVGNVMWTIGNLCRGKRPTPNWDLIYPLIPLLARALYAVKKVNELQDTLWALSYITDGDESTIQAVIDTGAVTRMVMLMTQNETSKIIIPGIRTLGNIVTGNDEQTQSAINCGALALFRNLLLSHRQKEALRKEVCWALSNITAGTTEQLQAVIDANLVPLLVDMLANADFKTKREACWAISNFATGALRNPAQLRFLVRQGVIKPLCDLLSSSDVKVLNTTLEAIEALLKGGEQDAVQRMRTGQAHEIKNENAQYIEEAGGADKLYLLQDHDNEEIYAMAFKLIENYFDTGSDDELDADEQGPAVDAQTGQFVFGQPAGVPQGGFSFQ
ncbi:importin alpha subunit [Catenaria anguillulae PL171]|uniref:Importin subunit alpha n=1 Tax=Catenaria anguillulae PL171 TaxID=765915 RepID=A0A1Y2I5V9_9FUNG|nr:importin alpha subunit [Catenaria anguillulae PL171]